MRLIVFLLSLFISKMSFADSTYQRITAKVISVRSYLHVNLIIVKNVADNKVYRIFSKREIEIKIRDTTLQEQNEQRDTVVLEGNIYEFCIKAQAVEIEPDVKIFTSDKFDIKYGVETILPQNETPYVSSNLHGLKYSKVDGECSKD